VGTVEFRSQSDGRIAKGKIDEQGRFQLSTFGNNDGAVGGEHQVVVVQHFDPRVWTAKEISNPALSPGHAEHAHEAGLVHRRYADYKTSGLNAVVKPNPNSIDLDVGDPVPLPKPRRGNR
jgi:hypothetical protein